MPAPRPASRTVAEETLRVLDFGLVRQSLAGHAQTPMGRDRLLALQPTADREWIEGRQSLIEECRALLAAHGRLALGAAEPLDEALPRAAIAGTVLEPPALLAVARTAGVIRQVRERLAGEEESWPRLARLAAGLADLRPLVRQIEAVLDEEGEVRDDASPALGRLRQRQRRLRDRVVGALERMVRDEGVGEALQDRLVTRRGGRYVVPVRADRRGSLRGIVHDTSSSGQTLYVEPLDVLDQQNELAEVERGVDKEVQRLLAEITAHVRSAAPALRRAVSTLGELDALQGAAAFAALTDAVRPQFVDAGLRLRGARHPLMIEAARQDDEELVPLDLELQPDQTVLVITGPNTGGKTVALKTVGVVHLLAQCGLPVPASEARLPCCPRIHADIGDEQSIVSNLSTFSAHLNRIHRFLRDCPAGSLVLLDELGTGTDPEEGAALGIALVERFDSLGALALVSTHHDALKAFAHGYPTAVNAAMEFDGVTLRPTYRLRLGLPGRSNAFDIARRLGLDARLVERARGLLRRDTAELDSLLRSVEGEAEALASDRRNVEQERRRLAEELAEARAEAGELRRLYEELQSGGRQAIREAVDAVRRRGEELLEELAGDLESARSRADRRARWAAGIAEAERRSLERLRQGLAERSEIERATVVETSETEEAATAGAAPDPDDDGGGPLRRGDAVVVLPLGLQGTVGRDWEPGDEIDEVEVEVRGKRLIVERQQVRKVIGR